MKDTYTIEFAQSGNEWIVTLVGDWTGDRLHVGRLKRGYAGGWWFLAEEYEQGERVAGLEAHLLVAIANKLSSLKENN